MRNKLARRITVCVSCWLVLNPGIGRTAEDRFRVYQMQTGETVTSVLLRDWPNGGIYRRGGALERFYILNPAIKKSSLLNLSAGTKIRLPLVEDVRPRASSRRTNPETLVHLRRQLETSESQSSFAELCSYPIQVGDTIFHIARNFITMTSADQKGLHNVVNELLEANPKIKERSNRISDQEILSIPSPWIEQSKLTCANFVAVVSGGTGANIEQGSIIRNIAKEEAAPNQEAAPKEVAAPQIASTARVDSPAKPKVEESQVPISQAVSQPIAVAQEKPAQSATPLLAAAPLPAAAPPMLKTSPPETLTDSWSVAQLSPELFYKLYQVTDRSSGISQTFLSKPSFGLNYRYEQRWSAQEQLDFWIEYTQLEMEPPSNRTFTMTGLGNYAFGVQYNYLVSDRNLLALRLQASQEFFFRATQSFVLAMDKVLVPSAGVVWKFNLMKKAPFSLWTVASYEYLFAARYTDYAVDNGTRYGVGLQSSQNLGGSGNWTGTLGVNYRFRQQNTDFSMQTDTDLFFNLGLRYLIPATNSSAF